MTTADAVVADEAGVTDDALPGDQRVDTPGGEHEEGERSGSARTVDTAARESLLVPVHWATFNLSTHWWAEPVRRLRRAADAAGVPVAYPRVGERVDLTDGTVREVSERFADQWWTVCAAPGDVDAPDVLGSAR